MNTQRGFTLIELVMVIVIIGILSAVALPKFAAMSDNAESASLSGARGSVASGAAIAHAQYLVTPPALPAGPITIEGVAVSYVNQYPDAETIAAMAGLDVVNDYAEAVTGGNLNTIGINGGLADCIFTYTEAGVGAAPVITAIADAGVLAATCP